MAVALGLAIRPNSQSYAEFKITKERIEEMCGLFVYVNHSKIYLIHQTAKEFLIQKDAQPESTCWKYSFRPDESETIMASICVNYLSLDELCLIGSKKRKRKNNHMLISEEYENDIHGLEALLEYSAVHWPTHVRSFTIGSETPVMTKVRRLYKLEHSRFQLWFTLLWRTQRPYEQQPHMNDIRLAAFNGHDLVLRHLFENKSVNLEAKDNRRRTALIWAAELGYAKVVKLLLDKQADVNAHGGHYGNALQAASFKWHEAILKLLLDKKANFNAPVGRYGNTLCAASVGGHEAIVKLLLDKQADVNAQGGEYHNALQAASVGGHEGIVKLLLDK